jgi:hypothetical protein
MNEPKTALDRAQTWCLRGTVEGGDDDETLSLVTADGFRQSLDVAAQTYEQAADAGVERVVFAVRDRRAPQARIVEGLRERGVPLERAPGVAAGDDPVVDELLQVTECLLACANGGDPMETTRSHLAARVDADVDLAALLHELAAVDDLGEALRTWVVKTDLIDRLVRADDGIHHSGTPEGTVDQHASADHLDQVLDVASTLDAAVAATDGYPDFGPAELARAIEESVMEDTQTLYRIADRTPADRPTAELCQMSALKLTGEADVVVMLELTERLLDADPSEGAFAVAPALSQHPDTPGVTTVTTDRAASTFGSTDHLADGKRSWFVGLGRRHLGNALAAASDRAVLVTRTSADRKREVTPGRTVVELQDVLGIEAIPATEFLPADSAAITREGVEPGELVDRLEARLSADGNMSPGANTDAPQRELAEQVADAINADKLSDAQLRRLLETVASHRRTETTEGEL